MSETNVEQSLTMLRMENFTPLTMNAAAVDKYIADVREVLAQIQAHKSPQQFHSLILQIGVRLERLKHDYKFTSNPKFMHCKRDLTRIRSELTMRKLRLRSVHTQIKC